MTGWISNKDIEGQAFLVQKQQLEIEKRRLEIEAESLATAKEALNVAKEANDYAKSALWTSKSALIISSIISSVAILLSTLNYINQNTIDKPLDIISDPFGNRVETLPNHSIELDSSNGGGHSQKSNAHSDCGNSDASTGENNGISQ